MTGASQPATKAGSPQPAAKATPQPAAKATPQPLVMAILSQPAAKAGASQPAAKAKPQPSAKAKPQPAAKAKPQPAAKAGAPWTANLNKKPYQRQPVQVQWIPLAENVVANNVQHLSNDFQIQTQCQII
uniref:Uncharacterized protein n=1 Tax=Cacopsylla melanoneura TaxID=428564 RepID=A0A8D8RRL3_9HEMI